MIDFDDEICTAVQMSKNMQNMVNNASGSATPWIDVFTSEVGLELVLYNGELGLYSVVHLKMIIHRGGGIEVRKNTGAPLPFV